MATNVATAALFLICGLAWVASGVLMLVRPRAALRRTQAPWTRLPPWGMRVLGAAVLIIGVRLFYLFAAQLQQ